MLSSARPVPTALTIAATLTLALAGPAQGEDGASVGGCGKFFCVGIETPGKAGSAGRQERDTDQASRGDDTRADAPPCAYALMDPQPPVDSGFWAGHDPADGGAVYTRTCGSLTDFVVAGPDGPPAAAVDPAVLAQQAVDKMLLRGPRIGTAPRADGKGVVGMPVYMWTARGPDTYGPNTASASAGGTTVTATAEVSRIVWQIGDGTAVTCTTAGTPYTAAYGKKPSPDCGHRYAQPSSTTPSGTYRVTATSTWTIDWAATTGQGGQLTEVRDSSVDLTVVEVQVLN